MNDLVSVIMPAYNSEKFIYESILSVVTQTYSNIELIIVLDGCIDGTEEIVNKLCIEYKNIYLIKLDINQGIANARNIGIKASSGRYLAFCDSDDIWIPNKIEIQINVMKITNSSISHGNAILINDIGQHIGFRRYPSFLKYETLLIRNYIINSTGIIDLFSSGPVFQKNIKHEDYDMWLSLLKRCGNSVGVDEALIKYRLHSQNITSNKIKSFIWMLKVQWNHNPSSIILYNILINIMSRLKIIKIK